VRQTGTKDFRLAAAVARGVEALRTGFLADAFLGATFLTIVFLAAAFLVAGLRAIVFLAAVFLGATFLAIVFLAAAFLVAGLRAAVFLAAGFAVDDLSLLKVFRGDIFFIAIFCSPWNVTEVTRAVLPQFPTGQRLVLRTIAPKPKHRNT